MKARLKKLIPSPRWRDILGLIVSAVLLWATLRQTSDDLWEVRLSWQQWCWVGVSLLLMGGVLWVQGHRMRWFLAKAPWRLKDIHGFRSVTIGSLYNAVLPGNLGEAVKMHHFARRNNIRFRTAMACWVSEKFTDGVVMALMSALLLLLPGFRESVLKWVLLLPVAVAAGCLTLVVASFRWPRRVRVLFRLIPTARAATFFYRVFLEFRWRLLGRPWRFRPVAFIVASFTIGLVNFCGFALNMWAGGVPDELIRAENLVMLMVLMSLIYFVPSAPSSVGVMHYGVYASLAVMAEMQGIVLTSEVKDSFVLTAIIFHATYVIPELVLGSIHLMQERKLVFAVNYDVMEDANR